MRVSVIVSTYNEPRWLELVLYGLSVQTVDGFELLVADDGSDRRTCRVLQGLQEATRLRPIHVRHADCGFRKCAILNRALSRAGGDYLVFLDGDCIPRADFVQRHVALAQHGRFLSGGAVRLPMRVCRPLTPEDVTSGRAHDWRWLRNRGMPLSRKRLRLLEPSSRLRQPSRVQVGPCSTPRNAGVAGSAAQRMALWASGPPPILPAGQTRPPMSGLFTQPHGAQWLARLLDTLTPTRPTFNGGNASAWRDDLLRVNGFDERMGHGGLDRELGERLENAGIRGMQVRHRCVCVHLDHPRAYADPAVKAFNRQLRRQTRQTRAVWTPHGVVKPFARVA